MILAHIVATTINGVVGVNGSLPWNHVGADLRFFKELTMGRVVIMGVNTYDSIPVNPTASLLPGRFSVVDVNPNREDKYTPYALQVPSLIGENKYSEIAKHLPKHIDDGVYFIIGGGNIYSKSINDVDLVWRNVIHPKDEIIINEDDVVVTYPTDILKRDFVRIKSDVISDPKAAIICELWMRKK